MARISFATIVVILMVILLAIAGLMMLVKNRIFSQWEPGIRISVS